MYSYADKVSISINMLRYIINSILNEYLSMNINEKNEYLILL